MGMRVGEAPLPKAVTLNPEVLISGSQRNMPRAAMFRKLPYGSTPLHGPVCCDANDPATQVRGLQVRLGRGLPTPQPAALRELTIVVDEYLAKIPPLNSIMSVEEWLDTTSYNQKRKSDLLATFDSLHGAPPTFKQKSKISSFIKREMYPTFKAPRWINSRSDFFKVYSGPAFKGIEQVIYNDPHFAKHIPVPLRPARILGMKKDSARYFATDFTSFEASFTQEVMQCLEIRLYSHMLKNFPQLRDEICSTICGYNSGSTRAGVRFRCHGQRMSGDMCTSLGNGFSNYMVVMYMMKKHGHKEWDCVVEGDDGLVAVYDEGPLPVPEDYADLGFSIKIEHVDEPELASFCGVKYVDGQILRDPSDFLMSFGWTSSFMTAGPKIMHQLLRAKALSAVYETPQCPIVGAIARRALEKTAGYAPRFVFDGYHDVPRDTKNTPDFAPSDKVRDVFARLYGIDAEAQKEIENKILNGDDDELIATQTLLPPLQAPLFASQCYIEVGG